MLLIAAGILGIAVTVTRHVSDIAVGIADLWIEGGVIQLREPMRPIRGTTRVLIVAWTAWETTTCDRPSPRGACPAWQPCWAARSTGTSSSTPLPCSGHSRSCRRCRWRPGQRVVRAGARPVQGSGPVSVQDYTHTIEMFSERLFDGAIGVPTLFERIDVRSHVSLMPVFRGADLLTIPAPRDLAELVGALATGLADEETPIRREPYEALDRAAVDQALEAFREHGIPDLQVVYL